MNHLRYSALAHQMHGGVGGPIDATDLEELPASWRVLLPPFQETVHLGPSALLRACTDDYRRWRAIFGLSWWRQSSRWSEGHLEAASPSRPRSKVSALAPEEGLTELTSHAGSRPARRPTPLLLPPSTVSEDNLWGA